MQQPRSATHICAARRTAKCACHHALARNLAPPVLFAVVPEYVAHLWGGAVYDGVYHTPLWADFPWSGCVSLHSSCWKSVGAIKVCGRNISPRAFLRTVRLIVRYLALGTLLSLCFHVSMFIFSFYFIFNLILWAVEQSSLEDLPKEV